jgi:hypothetical protein
LTTLAAKRSPGDETGSRSLSLLANLDLIVLAVALPVFIVADLPLSGYFVAAGLWIVARLSEAFSERKAKEKLLAGDRKTAMGTVAATSLGRAWVMAAAILVAGLISRDAGFYGAIVLVILFTVHLGSKGLVHLLTSDQTI